MSLVTSTTFIPGLRLFSSTSWLMILLSLRSSGSQVMGAARLLMRIERNPQGPLFSRWMGTPCSTSSGVAPLRILSMLRIACLHSAATPCLPVFSLSSSSSTVIGMATWCSWKFNSALGSWIRTLVSRAYRVGAVGRERPWSSILGHLLIGPGDGMPGRRSAAEGRRPPRSGLCRVGEGANKVRADGRHLSAGFGGLPC
ncbi:hypothetical protein D3C80_1025810 [compost metagenome]